MDHIEYNTGFGIIPRNIMRDKALTVEAKAIYAYLASFAGNKEYSFPGRDLMCDELGMSKERLSKHMKILKDHGYLEVEQKKTGGKFSHNIYRLIPYPKSSDTENLEPCTENPCTGNLATNNNSINNNNNNIYAQRYEMAKGFTDEEKDKLWSLYPKKVGKKNAYKYMDRLHKQGYSYEMIVWAIEEYADKVKKANTEMKYIKQGDTFFNTGIYDYIDNYKPRVKKVEDSGETGEFANFLDMVKRGGLE